MLQADICQRAVHARDIRFDGIFFVGITTTRVYCRPVCPARVSYPERRRFFETAASAERAGYRPCLRCRPELAPGRALMDAVPRLARLAAQRIAAGALNGRSVTDLAGELGVSERHLRRALERQLGVSPAELAQTHRLLLAKRLLAETSLPVTRIAFASGFQSLRRFNSVFRERYRLSPSALRRAAPTSAADRPAGDFVTLTLAYRPPLDWQLLTGLLRRDAMPGVTVVENGRYGRTVNLDGRRGVVLAEQAKGKTHLDVAVSLSLLPVLMPLLARLRQLFDLDAEPAVVDAHLAQNGLASLVQERPGIRIPGVLDGFEVALRTLLSGPERRDESGAAGTGGRGAGRADRHRHPVAHPIGTHARPGGGGRRGGAGGAGRVPGRRRGDRGGGERTLGWRDQPRARPGRRGHASGAGGGERCG